jgi:hypothetical protein
MNCCKKQKKKPDGDFRVIPVNFFNPKEKNELSATSEGRNRIQEHEMAKTKKANQKRKPYPVNRTKTSKYNLLSFFPLALIYHFAKYTNMYFLIVMAI